MSSGTVPIGSNSGEIPYVIGKEGLIFEEDNYISLQSSIQKLIDNPQLLHQLSKAGREKVLKQYSWEHIAKKTIDFYKEVYSP